MTQKVKTRIKSKERLLFNVLYVSGVASYVTRVYDSKTKRQVMTSLHEGINLNVNLFQEQYTIVVYHGVVYSCQKQISRLTVYPRYIENVTLNGTTYLMVGFDF